MFLNDIIGTLAKYHLPYPRVVALLSTCKQFRGHMGPSLVSPALLRFGRVTVHDGMVRMRDTNSDELVEIGLVHQESSVLMLRYNGEVYHGTPKLSVGSIEKPDFVVNGEEDLEELVHKFRHCYASKNAKANATLLFTDLFNEIVTQHNDSMRVWFMFVPCTEAKTVRIRVCMRLTEPGYTRVIRMTLHSK